VFVVVNAKNFKKWLQLTAVGNLSGQLKQSGNALEKNAGALSMRWPCINTSKKSFASSLHDPCISTLIAIFKREKNQH
jgi:hypothetical protein